VLILPAWEDSPWRTHAILQHPNLTTLAHLPANQLKFIPSHKQLDKDLNLSTLRPADWPVDLIIIANEEGRQAYLHLDRLQNILIPGLQQACQDTNLTITLFPNNTTHPQQKTTTLVLPTPPTNPLPRNRPPDTATTPIINSHTTNSTTTRKETNQTCTLHLPIRETTLTVDPSLQQLGQHTLPHAPLTILELYGGTATGLEALLKAGHHINTYAWADTDPDAYTSLQHRITQMQEKYPGQLPPSATANWNTSLPLDITHITPQDLHTNFPTGIDIIIANLPTYPPSTQKHTNKIRPQELALKHIIRLIHFLYTSQPLHIGYILANTPSPNNHPSVQKELGPAITLDGPPCGSGAFRETRICQNLAPNDTLQNSFNQLPTPTLTINKRLIDANIKDWETQPYIPNIKQRTSKQEQPTLLPQLALPKLNSLPNSHAFCMKQGIPGPGLLYSNNTLQEPNATIRELLMGLQRGATAAQGLTEAQRRHIIGQSTDANIMAWLIKQIQKGNTTQYKPNEPLPTNIAKITNRDHKPPPSDNPIIPQTTPPPPQPIRWQPLHKPKDWIYTDGSLKKGQPRLGAAVIHSPTNTTTYIDASGQDETHTIMRAELVAIQVALSLYKDDPWIGIFTDSQTSLHAIQNELQRPSNTTYHHHKPLIIAIVNLLQYRIGLGLPTKLHKIRGHTEINGNDLADAAAKRVVTEFEKIPEHQKLTVTIGKHAERPEFWVMYTNKPPTPHISLATGPHSATLRPPWWTIPVEDRLCMHAFTKPSDQLRLKVRAATLRSLHHTSLYRRLITNAKTQGARTNIVGTALHSLIRNSPREGITILKFVYGQLYNGKLAYRYKHAPTDACPLCGLPDSCTHIAGQCNTHNDQFISRHNAACQLTHAAIRAAFKGGGTIYSPHDLRLVSMDAGTKHQTTDEDIADLTLTSDEQDLTTQTPPPNTDWLSNPPLTPFTPQRNRRIDVSIDTKTLLIQGEGEKYDEEGTKAPRYIPAWVLPQEDLDSLRAAGAGVAPDIIYARGVPADPTPEIDSFNRKDCSLLLFEIGFCRDLGCHKKRQEKTDKYNPLLITLRRYWGRVDLVCIPIGHAGTTLNETTTDIATALSQVRPSIAAMRKQKGHNTPETSKTALLHDTRTAKALLDKFCTLAQARLLGIIAHRQQKIKEQTTGNASTPTLEGDQRTAQRVNRHPPPQPPRQPTTAIT
jgi:ribonuclease HI